MKKFAFPTEDGESIRQATRGDARVTRWQALTTQAQ